MLILLLIILFGAIIALNTYYKRTNHWLNYFYEIRHLMHRGYKKYDVINLGSSQPYFAFDYSTISNIKGRNCASYPQYLSQDLDIIKYVSRNLKRGGTVIIPLSYLNFFGIANNSQIARYTPLSSISYIKQYGIRGFIRFLFPICYNPKLLKFLIKDVSKKLYEIESNPLKTENEFREDAMGYISRWNKGFKISIPETNIGTNNNEVITQNISLLKEIIDYCKEYKFTPIVTILPSTKYLLQHFSPDFLDQHLYAYIKQAAPNVTVLNYLNRDELRNKDLFLSSFFMNENGRRIMTKTILTDIGLIND